MRLFIARHGQASFDAPSDFERSLTEMGKKQTEELFQQNRSIFDEVDEIWCSQLNRAKQTAAVYELGLSLSAQEKTFLTPDSDAARVVREVSKSSAKSLLIVSHQPLVGELVSMFVEGNPYQAHPFTTSEVVVLDMEIAEAGLASLAQDLIPL